jgi:hypothetical protein
MFQRCFANIIETSFGIFLQCFEIQSNVKHFLRHSTNLYKQKQQYCSFILHVFFLHILHEICSQYLKIYFGISVVNGEYCEVNSKSILRLSFKPSHDFGINFPCFQRK